MPTPAPLRLYDTRRRAVHDLVPAHTVRMYVCGITPYDAAHLGHAFTYVAFDALVRYLDHLGHRVIFVRNVTDVDDDILNKAREIGESAEDLARREVERFDRELDLLGVRAPDAEPWVSDTIPAIRTAVAGLLQRGVAYALPDGRVYFDTQASPTWGAFSGHDSATMLAEFAEKGGDPDAAGKRDALDFLLWQPSAPDEPSWDAPWGAGRPGWHIECSVMAAEELGNTIDIHGGGADLVFPHHEAEIQQAEHLTGQAPFARHWLHTGMVGYDGEKMSKSLGNLVFVGELVERTSATAVRRLLLANHYRTPWTFTDDLLDEAVDADARWWKVAGGEDRDLDAEARFHTAMRDDLDTPAAIAAVDDAAEAGAGATVAALAEILGFPTEETREKRH